MSAGLRDMSLRYVGIDEETFAVNYRYENEFFTVWFEVLKDPYTGKEYPGIYTEICVIPKDEHPRVVGCIMQDRRLTPLKGDAKRIRMGYYAGFFLDKKQMFVDINESSNILYQEAKALVYECDRIARTDFENCSVLPQKGEGSDEEYFGVWKKLNEELGKKQDRYRDEKNAERERAKKKNSK